MGGSHCAAQRIAPRIPRPVQTAAWHAQRCTRVEPSVETGRVRPRPRGSAGCITGPVEPEQRAGQPAKPPGGRSCSRGRQPPSGLPHRLRWRESAVPHVASPQPAACCPPASGRALEPLQQLYQPWCWVWEGRRCRRVPRSATSPPEAARAAPPQQAALPRRARWCVCTPTATWQPRWRRWAPTPWTRRQPGSSLRCRQLPGRAMCGAAQRGCCRKYSSRCSSRSTSTRCSRSSRRLSVTSH